MSSPDIPLSTPASGTPEENPFPYGWRYVRRTGPDGREQLEQVPLTLEDVLHPQEDDVIPENSLHEKERGDLARIFRTRLSRLRNGLVLSDCLIDWNVRGMGNHAPDISLFAELKEQPPLGIGTFHLADYGGRCLAVMELVSPNTRTNDVDRKLDEYYKVGVPLYIIVDQEVENGPRELLAYRHTPAGYESIELDEKGRILLAPLGLWLSLRDNLVVCHDAKTGAEIGDYIQLTQILEVADQRDREREGILENTILESREHKRAKEAAEQTAREQEAACKAAEERERQQAEGRQAAEKLAREQEAARKAAEERERQQAEARATAEKLAREQQEARKAAEERERQQAEARTAAEKLAREQEEARKLAEDRDREKADLISRLQAELEKLRGQASTPPKD